MWEEGKKKSGVRREAKNADFVEFEILVRHSGETVEWGNWDL